MDCTAECWNKGEKPSLSKTSILKQFLQHQKRVEQDIIFSNHSLVTPRDPFSTSPRESNPESNTISIAPINSGRTPLFLVMSGLG